MDGYVQTQVSQIDGLQSPWVSAHFSRYDRPRASAAPRVAGTARSFGGLDLQVLVDQNRPPLDEALSDNPDVTVEVLPRANHLFQAATTGSPAEYAMLEQDFVGGFLETISDWILARFGS